jgi:hypothetical protein
LVKPHAGIGQVLTVGRELEDEGPGRVDAALLLVEAPIGQAAAILVVELLQRHEAVLQQRRGILRRLHHVLGVGRDEGAAMLRLEEGIDDDLLGLEVVQVDDGDPGIRLVVDEQPAAVVVAVGLRQGGMVGIAVGDVLAANAPLGEHGLGLVIEAVALPGLGGEDPDVLEDAHRRDAIDDDLAGLAAGTESQVLIACAGGRVGLGCGQQILFRQATALHHAFEIFRGRRRSRGGECSGEDERGYECGPAPDRSGHDNQLLWIDY